MRPRSSSSTGRRRGHSVGGTDPVQLHVEAAGVAHGLSVSVASPQRGGAGAAVGAAQSGPAGRRVLRENHNAEEDKVCWQTDHTAPA